MPRLGGGGAAVAVVLLEDGEDVPLLHFLQRQSGLARRGRRRDELHRLFLGDGQIGLHHFESTPPCTVDRPLEAAQRARLGEEFDYVEVDGPLGGVEIAEPGEDDHLNVRLLLAQLLEHVHPVHAGQVQVEDDDVVGMIFHRSQRRLGRPDAGRIESHLAHCAMKHVPQSGFVLDNEDLPGLGGRPQHWLLHILHRLTS